MSNKRPEEAIKKIYTCETPGGGGCSIMYHALTTAEFEWYKKQTKKEQDTFDSTLLKNHLKSCTRKDDYATSKP